MTSEEIVRAVFEGFGRRDSDAVVALCASDCEFWLQGTAEEVGRTEPYRGHAGVREYFADVARVWGELELSPGELRVAGEGVVAFGRAQGRSAARVLDAPVIWVFKLRGGRVQSVRAVATRAEATRVLADQQR